MIIFRSKKVLVVLFHHYSTMFWESNTDDNFSVYFYQQVMVLLEDNYSEILTALKVRQLILVNYHTKITFRIFTFRLRHL